MAVDAKDLTVRLSADKLRTASLSQSIVAGLTAIIDAGITAGMGFGIYAWHVAGVTDGKLPFYAAAILMYTLLVVQTFYVARMYRFTRVIAPAQYTARILAICGLLFLLLITFGFALKVSDQYSRLWGFAWICSIAVLIPTGRFGVANLVRHWARSGRIRRNIAVYGAGDQGERLIRHLEALNEPWNRVIGVFDDRSDRVTRMVAGHPVLGGLADLVSWARENRPDEVLIALPWSAETRLTSISQVLAALPANIRLSPEVVSPTLALQRVSFQFGVPMLSMFEKPMSGWSALTKTAIDFALGAAFLLLASPVMLLAALAIKIESRGPVLFRQKRYGFNNELIGIFKFRTMYTDRTDADAERLVERADPRVTRVGAVLRRFSIDELPQLLNVLRGEMSVVGPRPHALQAKAAGRLYSEVVNEYAVRHKVKPGITGWAQVNGWRGNTETEKDIIGRVEHDLYYIDNWSLLLDFSIILRTIWVVVQARNSY